MNQELECKFCILSTKVETVVLHTVVRRWHYLTGDVLSDNVTQNACVIHSEMSEYEFPVHCL